MRSTRAADRVDSEINGSWPPPGYLGRSDFPVLDGSGVEEHKIANDLVCHFSAFDFSA
jgi:hypothetical protein